MNKMFTIRDTQVMIGRDLVKLCAVGTKRLNKQVKRNIERFLEKFRFRFIGLSINLSRSDYIEQKLLKHFVVNLLEILVVYIGKKCYYLVR